MAPPTSSDVAVLGSANMDIFLAVERFPAGGETVTADHRGVAPGGKGLNQAVASARSGAHTAFLGLVGDDAHGDSLLATMRAEGLDTTRVGRSDAATGMAMIVLQPSGENTIVVVPGANGEVRVDRPTARLIRDSRVLVAQLEVPLATVTAGVAVAEEAGTIVVLNAAPAVPLDDALLRSVDVLVVNEHEAALLGGIPDPLEAARLLSRGGGHVVVTLGAEGAVLVDAGGQVHRQPGLPARAIDTTGAGDSFVGVLAAALSQGRDLPEAMRRGVAAGALAVERPGAVPAIPTLAEIEERLNDR